MIKESTGKLIEFTKNHKIFTDLIEHALVNELNFGYHFNSIDSLLVFSAVMPKGEKRITIPIKVIYQDSIMFWNIDDLIAIKLKRINEL